MTSPTSDHVVDALIARQLLDPAGRSDAIGVVAGVLEAPTRHTAAPEAAPVRRTLPQLVEVVAYLGGALVLAAGGLFLVQEWGDLGFGARVTMLGVVALVLAVAGVVASRAPAGGPALRHEANDSRRRLAGTLLTGAALTVSFLVGLLVDDYLDPGAVDVYWPVVAGAALGVLVAAVGYRIAPTAVGLLGMLAGLVTVVTNLVGAVDGNEGPVMGLALFLVGVGWLVLTELGAFRELTVSRAAGVATVLVGAQTPVLDGSHPWVGYLLTVLVAVLGVSIYLTRMSWPYLAGAVLAVTLVVPEAVSDWTDGSVGAIGGVLVTGVTLLLASLAGYQLRARATD